MRYVSIDIETTGLDHNVCDVIEFGAVIANTLDFDTPVEQLPSFHRYIHKSSFTGEPYALVMNAHIFQAMLNPENQHKVCREGELFEQFSLWLLDQGFEAGKGGKLTINVAGKNFASFDNRFLEYLPNYESVRFRYRFLDPAMMFLSPEDSVVPNLKTCLERSGLDGIIPHTAVEDARLVIEVIRAGFKYQQRR